MPKSTATHSTAVEDLVRQLYSLGRIRREIDRHALAELGSQGFLALGVIHLNGPARVSDVAQRLAIDLSVASRQVAALKRAGYVEQQPDTSDARAQLLSATERGREVLSDSHRRMVAAFGAVLRDWPIEDVALLTRLLEHLRTDFDALQEEPRT